MGEDAPAGHVVFVGMMGSGKTTVGRRVARHLDLEFIDTDETIVSVTGREIAEWFANRGEVAFRDAEEQVLAELLDATTPSVVATGGGAVLRAATRTRLCAPRHRVIWLRASPTFLNSRISQKAERRARPLLADDPAVALERLDEQRRDFYAEVADVIIDIEPVMTGSDKPRKAVAQLVVDTLDLLGEGSRR